LTAVGTLYQIDHRLFEWINHKLAGPVPDAVFPLLREKLFWVPLYVFVVAYVLYNRTSRQAVRFLLFLVLTVALADTLSSKLIKPLVGRLRPCHSLSEVDVRLLVHCGSGFSFPSSHAANHFAVAVFLIFSGLVERRVWKLLLLVWAAAISIAQVYVGVHYPLDVIGGAWLGISVGLLTARLYQGIHRAGS